MAEFTKYTSGFVVSGTNIGIQPAKITTAVADDRILSSTSTWTNSETAIPTTSAVQKEIDATLASGTAKEAGALSSEVTIKLEGDATGEATFQSAGDTATITVDVPYSGISGFAYTGVSANSASTSTGFAEAAATEKALAKILEDAGNLASFVVTAELPTTGKSNIVYLVGPDSTVTGVDKYKEYVYTNKTWTQIGDTSIDLSNYVAASSISAASANWDNASAFASTASANYETISGYATDWSTNSADVIGSANSGANASAWINTNSGSLLSSVNTSGYISGDGTSTAKIDLTNNATSAIEKVASAISTSADMIVAGNVNAIAEVGAITGYLDYTLDSYVNNDRIVSNISTSTETSSIPDVGAITAYAENYVQSAFGSVIVTTTTGEGGTDSTYNASAKNDTIKFVGGTNITLTTSADKVGNPTIIFNGATTASYPSITGENGVTAEALKDSSNLITAYSVSGVDATTANAGVVKADYYSETDGLIHLF